MTIVGVLQVLQALAHACTNYNDPKAAQEAIEGDLALNRGCIMPLISIASLISTIMWLTFIWS